MVFKPKFFLNLSGADQQQPVIVAPTRPLEEEVTAAATAPAASLPVLTIPAAAGSPAAAQAWAAQVAEPAPLSALTTAEAMAAELAATQADRPTPSKVTFSPERVTAGGATPMARRTGGANLAGFKEMAKGMMRS